MTIEVKHKFQSLKGDGSDLTQVQPSNWNDTHTLAQATGKVLGRVTAGAGPTEEIDWSAYGRQIINVADAAALRGLVGPVSNISDNIVTFAKLQNASAAAKLIGSNGNAALTITGTANNGSGLVRLTVTSTATFATGQTKKVAGVVGTTEANGLWTITVVDATHIDLQGSAFANNYVSGGTIGGGYEEITLGGRLAMVGNTLNTVNDTLLAQENSNVGGMAIVVGNNVRSMNALAHNTISGASLSGGGVILPPGTYLAFAHASIVASGGVSYISLRDTTAGLTVLTGPVGSFPAGTFVTGLSLNGSGNVTGVSSGSASGGLILSLFGKFTLAAQGLMQLQNASSVTGVGGQSASLTPNTYAELLIMRVG